MTDLVKHEKSFESSLMELESMQNMCNKLLQMKHYQKLGDVGIFAILQKAKSVGLNPLDALNGGMYFVNGKVELSANTMNYLIRQSGHSIVKDDKSTKDICILRGKRIDNGDTMTCSFSIDDAKKAGIFKNVWQSYPEDMLFARALTRLARQLFPDVTKGCYIEGEIPRDMKEAEYEEVKDVPKIEHIDPVKPIEYITESEANEIRALIRECDPMKQQSICEFLTKKCGGEDIVKLKKDCFPKIRDLLVTRRNEYQDSLLEKPTSTDEVIDE